MGLGNTREPRSTALFEASPNWCLALLQYAKEIGNFWNDLLDIPATHRDLDMVPHWSCPPVCPGEAHSSTLPMTSECYGGNSRRQWRLQFPATLSLTASDFPQYSQLPSVRFFPCWTVADSIGYRLHCSRQSQRYPTRLPQPQLCHHLRHRG